MMMRRISVLGVLMGGIFESSGAFRPIVIHGPPSSRQQHLVVLHDSDSNVMFDSDSMIGMTDADFEAMMNEMEAEQDTFPANEFMDDGPDVDLSNFQRKKRTKNNKDQQQPRKRKQVKKESKQEEKRRLMFLFKKLERQRKWEERIERDISFEDRTPLTEYEPNKVYQGKCISLTNFGAYIDIGTECDGLLHISQMSREYFVQHPRQVVLPGETIEVMVLNVNPELKKLQLTLLPQNVRKADYDKVEDDEDDNDDELITLEELAVDDELWGELKRITSYGAYVDVGAEVRGFLHFMDHPQFEYGSTSNEYMELGQRVRVWVSEVDVERRRIKLTANRPDDLPGPRLDVEENDDRWVSPDDDDEDDDETFF